MSARVLNPAMMSEMGHRGIVGSSGPRVAPSGAALTRVRRDLFGPVDHAAARAYAEREIRAQSLLDKERWGFDFQLGIPINTTNSRYEWSAITSQEVVPEPYALRGMPYLRKHAPGTPTKIEKVGQTTTVRFSTRKRSVSAALISPIATSVVRKAERTPPQEPRVPENGDVTNLSDDDSVDETCGRKKKCMETREPTTPVLPPSARKQPTITDYMKICKRTLNSAKSIVELPEKIARNAGQIRS